MNYRKATSLYFGFLEELAVALINASRMADASRLESSHLKWCL